MLVFLWTLSSLSQPGPGGSINNPGGGSTTISVFTTNVTFNATAIFTTNVYFTSNVFFNGKTIFNDIVTINTNVYLNGILYITNGSIILSNSTIILTNGSSIVGLPYLTNTIGITVDGGGSPITTGLKGYIEAPYACTITGWTLIADQSGSIVFDIWNEADPYDGSGVLDNPPTIANTITASAKPTLSTQQGKTSTTLTGWDVAVGNRSVFAFNVDSATTITRATLVLTVIHAP